MLSFFVGALLGLAVPSVGIYWLRRHHARRMQEQEQRAQLQVKSAHEMVETRAREAEIQNKTEQLRIKEDLERQMAGRNAELETHKRRIEKKEAMYDRKFELLDQRDRHQEQHARQIEADRRRVEEARERYQALLDEARQQLERTARLTTEEARTALVASIEEDARRQSARMIKEREEDAKATATQRAQDVVSTAIQRYAGELVAEHTVSVVTLPTDDMKGRIIGREGRNIRALEAATGCDLIIDDTPEAVVVSGFHPVRRQVAKRALEELVTDGRIHPARIEEVVRKTRKNVNTEIREAGEQAVFELGLHGVHQEIIKLLGTLKFRTSYSQNVLRHATEVAFFAGIMAEELGLDGDMARRCGLLHDIGKAVDHETQGSHAVIGGRLAKKYREHPTVVNAIWSHHFDIEPTTVYGPLTNAADTLSAARPGARRENVETYIKRLEQLERIALDRKGVTKAYAIQAGRELRVIVASELVNDLGAMSIASDVARQVEEEMTYPGQIKITVIREMRATEVAN